MGRSAVLAMKVCRLNVLPVLTIAFLLMGCSALHAPRITNLPADGTVLPTRDSHGLFLVDARINDRGPFTLIVDSGVQGLVLTSPVSDQVGLDDEGRAGIVRVGDFQVRDVVYAIQSLEAVSAALDEEIHGILGYGVFRDVLLTFDYPEREVRLTNERLHSRYEDVFRYELIRSLPHIDLTICDRAKKVLVDTGATGTLAFPSESDVDFLSEPSKQGQSAGLTGWTATRSGRSGCDAYVAGVRLVQPPVTINPSLRSSLIGEGVLRRFSVSFDQRSALVRLRSTDSQEGRDEREGHQLR